MDFLIEEGIDNKVFDIIPDTIKNDIENNIELVKSNINYLKDLGVSKYLEIFKNYYPMFLMDYSNFKNVFNKYDKADLLEKIDKNIAIIEHL